MSFDQTEADDETSTQYVEKETASIEEKTITVNDIVNARRIIDGPADKLRAVSATKYPWVRGLWAKMRGNRWEVEQVSLVRDQLEFRSLSQVQQMAFRRSLAFLSNLDSIQTENLSTNVSQIITDPTISQLIARQTFEEWIHVEMYSAITETIFSDPLEIYDMYRHVPSLSTKNDFITMQGATVTDYPSAENKIKAFVSNIALEGIYFFSGFLTFYAINRATGKMNGTVDAIKYIQRDEMTHLEIFVNIVNSLRVELPELFTKQLEDECKKLIREATALEIEWGQYVIGGGMPEVNHVIIDSYIKYLAEQRAASIGLAGVFPGYTKNPIPWVDEYSNFNNSQGNFFESKPITYTETKPKFSRKTKSSAAIATTAK